LYFYSALVPGWTFNEYRHIANAFPLAAIKSQNMQVKILIALCLLCTFSSYGQQNPDSAAAQENKWKQRFDSSLTSLHVDTLEGKIKTLYSKNYRLRAETIQLLVENCAKYYEQKFPDVKFTAELLLLDSNNWKKLPIAIPYGMPSSMRNKLLIAADKKAVGKLFGQTDTLPDNQLSDFDYIALHELGHNFLFRLIDTDTKQRWANEFLASYFAICYLNDTKSKKGLPQINRTEFQPKHKTLEDFERLYSGVGAQNYAWYQGKFQELGYKLYPKFKIELIRVFMANYKSGGKQLEAVTLLKQMAPEITRQFLKEMK
jgi:hypothetical protein